MTPHKKDAQRRFESIERLIGETEKVADPAVRSLTRQVVQSLMDLHGATLERTLEIVHSADGGQQIIDQLGRDDLVGGLLLLYGLHPLDLPTRVLQALEANRPVFRSHGSNLELVSISDSGAVVLRLEAASRSCPSSTSNLQATVEQAICDAAPDVTSVVIQGLVPEGISGGAFIPLSAIQNYGNNPDLSGLSALQDPSELQDTLHSDGHSGGR